MIIKSRIKNYTVTFMDHVLEHEDILSKSDSFQRNFYLVDRDMHKIYQGQLESVIDENYVVIIPASERAKSFQSLARYYRWLIEAGFRRNDTLVTFGGGVLQDISGFIASTLYRGVKWIFFPTTLLAQADSCIGSKTSINFDTSKNLIGTFYPPDEIYIDIHFLTTLKRKYWNSGIGEIIKFHLMADNKKYQLLKDFLFSPNPKKPGILKKIIRSTLLIKKMYFSGDEFDLGRRNLLNYGHTFGHALESVSDFKISHGEAVLLGIGIANLFSVRRGIMQPEKYEEIESTISKHYPSFNSDFLDPEGIISYMKKDKKRVGDNLSVILAEDIGILKKYDDAKQDEVRSAISEFKSNILKREPGTCRK